MAISESPGSRSSPGFCHICRQRNRSAQKQIICPIYRGWLAVRPYRKGLEQKILAVFAPCGPLERLSLNSFLRGTVNHGFSAPIQGVTAEGFAGGISVDSAVNPSDRRLFRRSGE